MIHDDPVALAAAETYLIHVLTETTPPGDPSDYLITDAVEAYRSEHGSYDIEAAGIEAARQLLARHTR